MITKVKSCKVAMFCGGREYFNRDLSAQCPNQSPEYGSTMPYWVVRLRGKWFPLLPNIYTFQLFQPPSPLANNHRPKCSV
mmetsp:Transcript_7311/g.9078  ORF Transcript_7311/g.9078 Transcript_7311/m.9078 type:complete len:80 (-) Transcript_7311:375-614(-)